MSQTSPSSVRYITVGVDGSPSADEALRWAVREAELTGDVVKAVIAWQYPVGSRGHGTFTDALLGSVSQHCAHHAKCPVVIVRWPRDHNHKRSKS